MHKGGHVVIHSIATISPHKNSWRCFFFTRWFIPHPCPFAPLLTFQQVRCHVIWKQQIPFDFVLIYISPFFGVHVVLKKSRSCSQKKIFLFPHRALPTTLFFEGFRGFFPIWSLWISPQDTNGVCDHEKKRDGQRHQKNTFSGAANCRIFKGDYFVRDPHNSFNFKSFFPLLWVCQQTFVQGRRQSAASVFEKFSKQTSCKRGDWKGLWIKTLHSFLPTNWSTTQPHSQPQHRKYPHMHAD